MSIFFISHSSKDNGAAVMLRERLVERQYESLFLDFDPADGIPVGQSWERTLYRKLQACDVVLVLFSDNHHASNWCFAEIALARMQGKHVVTLLIDPLTNLSSIPSILTEHQYLDLRKDDLSSLDKLWRGLAELGVEAEPERQWDPRRAPYPGMMAFSEDEAPVFFGREAETREIIEMLNAARRRESDRALTVLGGSGSGKSSILRAGVIPRLRRDPQWLVIEPFRPGREPVEELAARLIKTFDRNADEMQDLVGELRSTSIPRVMARLRRTGDRPEATPLLVVDQFEELLSTVNPGSSEFLHMLDVACVSEDLPVYMVFTLRSDFVAELHRRRDVPALLDSHQNTFSVGPMAKEAMRRVITQPARLCALELEDVLVNRLLDDTGTSDALPLLAFALRALWDKGHDDGLLSIAEYEELGGLGGAVAREADAALETVKRDPEVYDQVRAAFIRMSRLGENGGYARATTRWSDYPESVRDALKRFVDKRILMSRVENEVATLEIAHEALFRTWVPLVRWLEDETEVLRLREFIRQALSRWKQDQNEDDLLRGTRLARVRELVNENQLLLSREEIGFLEKSAQAEKERAIKEGNLFEIIKTDPHLREALEKKLKPVIEETIAEQRKIASGRYGDFDFSGSAIAAQVSILENLVLETPRWHPQEAEHVGETDATRDYASVYRFPCCGTIVYNFTGSQVRSDGCQPYDPEKDKPKS